MASPNVKSSYANARPSDRREGAAPQPGKTQGRSQAESGLRPAEDLMDYLREYARERPEVVALWCLGIGFVLGWKLKPW